jgi:hypothetical protein
MFPDPLNRVTSQVWVAFFMVLAIGLLIVACFCKDSITKNALITIGSSLVTGGFAVFRSDKAPPPPPPPPVATPQAGDSK